MRNRASNEAIMAEIAKGWKPHAYLTNMSIAYFQPSDWFVAPAIFPILPVPLSTSYYYEFSKADLARDNVQRKPPHGKVTPMIFGQTEKIYRCDCDQVIVGIDQITTLDYQRARTPGMADPRRAKVKIATEQLMLHMDRMFAGGFFGAGIWADEWAGVASNPTGKQFFKFGDSNFDPVAFFGARKVEMMRRGRRKPNVLALGVEAYEALRVNPDLLDRVKYSGSTPNPATVNTNVLAQLLEVDKVVVLNSVFNSAGIGETENMQFICDSKGALLCYSVATPAIDEATAGYIFAWDMLGNGQYIAMDQWEGEKGTHTEFVEGLMSYTMKIVCNDLGTYMKDCV
jgi:hypothetical protein